MTRRFTFLIAAAALCAAAPAAAEAAKPAPTGSTAPGQVFFPNPVQSLANESLTDQKDADYPALAAGYERKTLTNLDGSGTLTGDYAKVISETGTPARNTGSGFIYTRDQDQFEQVMGYYWITEAQKYIQSLGFGSTLRAVNKRQQLLRIDQFGGDNSFYRDEFKKLTITLGKGGVDDAEDGEVIVHEYGHSVQDDQVPGFGSSPDAGAIGEAFGAWTARSTTRRTCTRGARSTPTARSGRRRCGARATSSATRGWRTRSSSTPSSGSRRTRRSRTRRVRRSRRRASTASTPRSRRRSPSAASSRTSASGPPRSAA